MSWVLLVAAGLVEIVWAQSINPTRQPTTALNGRAARAV
ncbi:multidrug transporter EmrE-like cation transporter [Amycolatopsis magusensis]|uniref:Multidrug transporter EmrE-like cation transporter n=1 Tax=Amycolatopsis magusensis TaxID=882444 RepID=A0ABS4Q4Q0_9PSEU|nr:multidrug transporter EmrE-like cation transporter [Amycolatopsis magusensis]